MIACRVNYLLYDTLLFPTDDVHTGVEYDGYTLEVIEHYQVNGSRGRIEWRIAVIIHCNHLDKCTSA